MGLYGHPRKALLDLIYLTPDADSEGYLRALRLQNLDQLDEERLAAYVARADKPKLKRALAHIRQLTRRRSGDLRTAMIPYLKTQITGDFDG
ncbi:MAG: hypothetical protein HC804_13850 [Anaerolineae bacterium]|nr:hypothetical protein [Anaerolineae bacterium]